MGRAAVRVDVNQYRRSRGRLAAARPDSCLLSGEPISGCRHFIKKKIWENEAGAVQRMAEVKRSLMILCACIRPAASRCVRSDLLARFQPSVRLVWGRSRFSVAQALLAGEPIAWV